MQNWQEEARDRLRSVAEGRGWRRREQDGGRPAGVPWTPGEDVSGRGDRVNSFRGHCSGRWESNWGPFVVDPLCEGPMSPPDWQES